MILNKNIPKVTVLMAVYNAEKFLDLAIESILRQTYTNFEFLIINDGSTDKSLKIINSYKDRRIKVVSNDSNMGHTYCLNCGLDLALGEYVARMDSDDISLPHRLEKQVLFMESHKVIAVSGTWAKTIGDFEGRINKVLTDSDDIKANLLFYTSLIHPTVIIRNLVLKKHNLKYEIIFDRDENSEDYGLWSKLSYIEKLANIPEVLLWYRVHKKSVSALHYDKQKKATSLIRRSQLEKLGISPSENDIFVHNSLYLSSNENITDFLKKRENWLNKIVSENKENKIYNTESLNKIIYERWVTLCGLNANNGLIVWKKFKSSNLYSLGKNQKIVNNIKILIKSILR